MSVDGSGGTVSPAVEKGWVPAFYFLFYAAGASLVPFLALFYQSKGLQPGAIGFLGAIPPVMMLLGAPTWSGLADASHAHGRLLKIAISGAVVSVAVLSQMSLLWLLALAVAAYAFFGSPIMAIVDSATLQMLGDRRDRYGRIRLWGALGWGIAAPLVGLAAQRGGLLWPFVGYIVIMLVGIGVSFRLPLSRARLSVPFRHGAKAILRNPRWGLFLFVVFASGVGLASTNVFLFLYMAHLGASKTLMGIALTSATISELPFFFFTNRLIARWGARGLLIFGMGVYIIRVLLYSVTSSPWIVVLIQLLHGPTFSAIWVAGVSYADEIAPEGLSATAQGIFNATFMGLGGAVGALFAGFLYQSLGVDWMFRYVGLTVFAGIVVFLVAVLRSRRRAESVRRREG